MVRSSFNDKGDYAKTWTASQNIMHSFNGKIDRMLKRGLKLF